MRFLTAELHNTCQFRHILVRFAAGLTMIVGRNGSGKSNLVKMLYAAVAGDFGRNDGVKTDNICQFAEPGAPSKINLVLEHGDARIDITHSLRPIATRLKVTAPGTKEKTITKAQEATEEITTLLGVSGRMLADYVFVDQWSIFDFLSMMPAERAKAFQRLFRTERAEVLWKLVGDYHDNIVIPTPGISKDVVIKRITENREHYAILRRRLSEIEGKADTSQLAALHQTLADYQNRQAIEKEATIYSKRLEDLGKEVRELATQITQTSPDDETFTAYVNDAREAYMQARQFLGGWSTYDAFERNRQFYLRERERLSEQRALDTGPPEKPPSYVATTDSVWYEAYEAAKQEAYRLERLVTAIKSGVNVCASCGTIIQDAASKLDEYVRQLQAATKYRDEMVQQHEASRTYDTVVRHYYAWKKDTAVLWDNNEETLMNIAAVPQPSASREELREQIATYEKISKAQQHTHEALSTLRRQHEGKSCVYEQVYQDFGIRKGMLANLQTATKETAEGAQRQLDEYERLRSEMSTLTAQTQILERSIKDDEFSLGQLGAVEKEAGATRAWASHCMDMRHILHRDNLPRLVAHNYLELMQDEINNLLVRFGSPFNVSTDESLSFVATFYDGRKVPAGRLSGGEKVLLALAFRVVVNDIFAKDLGLLILDEPTAGLDEGNLTCLRIAIERLKELSAARGLQVIMITHERDLHNLFDHVIDMGKDA